ncbi:hypothetical protein NEFER03_1586 [Nematocida sp. LUAm3]|nr:hypothetical protein NEFER03_1586 [Nematocida sp. LUAm3]KAI5176383.1 hypothetical protein NEFER02_2157 [Nematocida sp. LUAm2]KAI5179043.1 hypothetical protein NEFER01_1919 [Nematocida sp. LUAm1]
MKGILVRCVREAFPLRGVGMDKEMYVAKEFLLQLSDASIRFTEPVQGTASDGKRVYVVCKRYIYAVEGGKIKTRKELELPDEMVRRVFLFNKRVYILMESEVIIWRTDGKETRRYMPYGSEILSMDVGEEEKKEQMYILLKSGENRVVRVVEVGSVLQEVSQLAVGKESYKIFVVKNNGFFVVEKGALAHVTREETVNMVFGNPLVRDGGMFRGMLVLCMFGNEVCLVDVEKHKVVRYLKSEVLVERVQVVGDTLILYNTYGDISVMDAEYTIKHIVKGMGRVERMDMEQREGRDALSLLEHTSEGVVFSRSGRNRVLMDEEEYHIRKKPLRIKKTKELLMVSYEDGVEVRGKEGVVYEEKESVIDWHVDWEEKYFIFIKSNGVISKYMRKKEKEKIKRIDILKTEKNIVFARVDGAGGCFADENNDIWNVRGKEMEKMSMVGNYSIISMELSDREIICCTVNGIVIIDRETGECNIYAADARWAGALGKSYLINRSDGSLCISGIREKEEFRSFYTQQDIRIGAASVHSIEHSGIYTLLQCAGFCILLQRVCVSGGKGMEEREHYQVSIFESPSICTYSDDTFLFHFSNNGDCLKTGKILINSGFLSEKITYKEDVVKAISLGGYTVAVSLLGERISEKGDFLRPVGLSLGLYRKEEKKAFTEYLGKELVDLLSFKDKIVIFAVNDEEGGKILFFRRNKEMLEMISSKSLSDLDIRSISLFKNTLYCGTSSGVYIYEIRGKDVFKRKDHPTQYTDAMYKVEKNIGIDISFSRIKVEDLCKGTHSIYLDKARASRRAVCALGQDSLLIGYVERDRGILSLIQKEKDFLHISFSMALCEEIKQIVSGEMNAVQIGHSAYVLLEGGTILKVSLIPEDLVEELVPGRSEDEVLVLSTYEGVPSCLWKNNQMIDTQISNTQLNLVSLCEKICSLFPE